MVIDYHLCEEQKPCTLCQGISLNSTAIIQPTSMSIPESEVVIKVANFETITTIPEFVKRGFKKYIVTEIDLRPLTNTIPWQTSASIQVYSLEYSVAVSYTYVCKVGEGINIFFGN